MKCMAACCFYLSKLAFTRNCLATPNECLWASYATASMYLGVFMIEIMYVVCMGKKG